MYTALKAVQPVTFLDQFMLLYKVNNGQVILTTLCVPGLLDKHRNGWSYSVQSPP